MAQVFFLYTYSLTAQILGRRKEMYLKTP